jgi:hypothetical protein
MPDHCLYITLNPNRREVRVYRVGGALVRTVQVEMISIAPHPGCGAEIAVNDFQAPDLVDSLAAAAHHWPENPSLDAHRDKIRALAAELRELRDDGPSPDAELATLALSRHAGQLLADAAQLIYTCRDHMAEYVVAGIAAELIGMLDAMIAGPALTNPEERIRAHKARIDDLSTHLPTPGATP